MAVLKVWLPVPPRQKERARATTVPIGPKCPRCKKFPTRPKLYTPKATEKWEEDVAALLRRAAHQVGIRDPMNGPIRVTVDFVKARTASRPGPSNAQQKLARHWYVTPEAWATGARVLAPTKPDVDNYGKAILDSINKARLWWDDSQVCTITLRKWYAATGEEPGILVRIEPA